MNKDVCRFCGVVDTFEIIICNQPSTHYAKAICKHCGKQNSWVKNPNGRKQQCETRLKRALTKEPYNRFYLSLQSFFDEHGSLSPAQFKALDKFN